MSDDAIADLRVLVASVGGDVKAVLAKLDDQNRRLDKAEEDIDAIWSKIHRWAGAAALVTALFSSGFLYLVYLLLH